MGKRRGGGLSRPGRGRSAEHGPEPVAESPCVNRDDNAAGHFKVPVKGFRRVIAARQRPRSVLGAGRLQGKRVDGEEDTPRRGRSHAVGRFHVHQDFGSGADRNLFVGHVSISYSVSRNQTLNSMFTRK